MIELSIIIPTYGRISQIGKSIESALIRPEFEVIVVDDNGKGSEHQLKTESILSEYISSNKISYYPLEKNSGAGVARNHGVDKAKGKYITFLDDDDFFIEDKILDKLKFFQEQPETVDICCSHMTVEKNNEKIDADDDQFSGADAKSFLLDGSCYTSMIMIKKSSFTQIGGFFSTPYLQDHTLMLKAYLNDLNVCVFDQAVFVHTLHDGITITTGKRPIAGVALRCELEKKLSEKVLLSGAEKKRMNYRWDTIQYHADWLQSGRSLTLFTFLMQKLAFTFSSKKQAMESFKLVTKFFVNYQYYSK